MENLSKIILVGLFFSIFTAGYTQKNEKVISWDETHSISAHVGNYFTVARRHGETWYLGSMTDWNARDFEIKLDFLPEGNFRIESWSDGPNAERKGEDFAMNTGLMTKNSILKVHLSQRGGYVARLKKQ